jgi:hypothetical protein
MLTKSGRILFYTLQSSLQIIYIRFFLFEKFKAVWKTRISILSVKYELDSLQSDILLRQVLLFKPGATKF